MDPRGGPWAALPSSPLPLISFYPIYDDAESLLLGEFAVLDLLSIIVHYLLLVLLSQELNHIH